MIVPTFVVVKVWNKMQCVVSFEMHEMSSLKFSLTLCVYVCTHTPYDERKGKGLNEDKILMGPTI